MVTPAHTSPPSRIGTTKACTPSALTADLELGEDHGQVGVHRGVADVVLPRVLAGRLDTNSWASASYVATVPSAWTLDPWPVSVIAKQPMVSPVMSLAR